MVVMTIIIIIIISGVGFKLGLSQGGLGEHVDTRTP